MSASSAHKQMATKTANRYSIKANNLEAKLRNTMSCLERKNPKAFLKPLAREISTFLTLPKNKIICVDVNHVDNESNRQVSFYFQLHNSFLQKCCCPQMFLKGQRCHMTISMFAALGLEKPIKTLYNSLYYFKCTKLTSSQYHFELLHHPLFSCIYILLF